MNDIYIPKKVPRIEVREKLHGHTQILLRSVKTGKVERIEHDNMFTDGIDHALKSFGVYNSSPLGNYYIRPNSIWSYLVGGIFLFDKPLSTSPMSKYMPAGSKMTANGSYGVSNSSNPTELGSYNGTESVISDGSISFVYDWGTSQGNGEISSVALTTRDGGVIGYGNNSGGTGITRNMDRAWSSSDDQSGNHQYIAFNPQSGTSSWGYHGTAELVGSYIYTPPVRQSNVSPYYPCVLSGATSVDITKRHVAVDGLDLWDQFPENGVSSSNGGHTETITFTFNALSYNYFIYPTGMGKFVLIPNRTDASQGAQYRMIFLNLETETVDDVTFINPFTQKIQQNHPYGGVIPIDDTYCIVPLANGNDMYTISSVHKLNYRTGEDAGEIANWSGINWRTLNRQTCIYSPLDGSGTFLLPQDNGGSSSGNYYRMMAYDVSQNKVLNTNGRNIRYGQVFGYSQKLDLMVFGDTGVNTNWVQYRGVFLHPLRLMTINNLDETVTKDQTKTMKVTYTITRSA